MSILPQASRHALKQLGQRLINALMPGSCLLCGIDSGLALLCPSCEEDLPVLATTRCPYCALPSTYGERCGACLKTAPHFDCTVARFRYDFPANRLIHALKYGHQLALAPWFAQQLAPLIDPAKFDRIVPLPLHPERLRERGFNQSAEIAKVLGICLDLPVDRSSVLRTRPTPRQADLPLKERHRNVRGAFESTTDFSQQRVLLIDDVMTSGATVNECARVLKLHGAQSVGVAIVARALKH